MIDPGFQTNVEKFEPLHLINTKFSFSNIDNFFCSKDSFDLNFNKYEEMEHLFKLEEKNLSINKTFFNTKELKSDNDKNMKKKEEIILDKNYIESIQFKVKEKILSKRPFKEKKNLGRKKKQYEGLGEHNKFSDDNIIRKIKRAVLQNVRIYINQKIISLYKYDNEKLNNVNKLFKLKQNHPMSSRSAYNKDFLEKTLGVIFSRDISSKYSRHPSTHNKKLIESLINDKDEKKRSIFNKIFNLTFIDCLNHFRGSKKFEELDGMNNLEDYLKEQRHNDDDEEYCSLFKYFVNNFEKIILNKKERIRVKK